MPQATITSSSANQFAVTGNLSFDTVTNLLEQGKSLFAPVDSITLDLSAVSHADSAGLALLLEWLRYGKQHNKVVRFINIPAQLKALAAISEVETMLVT